MYQRDKGEYYMATKLIETKAVELSGYSSIEMLYLLQDILRELSDRELRANKVQSEMDKTLSTMYHEIEFNEFNSAERTKMFADLKSHLQKRRMAKNEVYTIQRFSANFDVPKMFGKLGRVISDGQSQMHKESGQPVYPQGAFSRFYRDYLAVNTQDTTLEE